MIYACHMSMVWIYPVTRAQWMKMVSLQAFLYNKW